MKLQQSTEQKFPNAGVYEHYKSTATDPRYCQVLGTAQHTETGEKLVVYVPLYVKPEHTGPRIAVRPLEMFMEDVEHSGQTLPRFRYIGTELS